MAFPQAPFFWSANVSEPNQACGSEFQVASEDLYVNEMERGYIGWCASVFSQPEKKEGCNDNHICYST